MPLKKDLYAMIGNHYLKDIKPFSLKNGTVKIV